MKIATYIGGLLGLILLVVLVVHSDLAAMMNTWSVAGWGLLWLVPYRAPYFLLYAIGWLVLLRPFDAGRRAGPGYVFWVTTVREAIDRLLPVASVGGALAGVRLMRWRGLAAVPVSATIIVEILLTLIVSYLFAALGVLLLIDLRATGADTGRLLFTLALTLPMPVISALLLRYGAVFGRLERILSPLVGVSAMSESAAELDRRLHESLKRVKTLGVAGTLQFLALVSGFFEIWLSLRLFGHPVSVKAALVLEGMNQAVRHLAFVIPAGIGVQEAGLVIFGQALGVGADYALCVSMAKRLREVLCGLPALLSWQWLEARRLRGWAGV